MSDSLQRTWQVAIAFAAVGILFSLALQNVPLRKELETEFGLAEETEKDKEGTV